MKDYLKLENLGGDFKNLLEAVRGGKPTTAFSLASGAKIHVSSALEGFVLYVTADRLAAQSSYEKFKAFLGDRVVFIADKDDILLHRAAYSEGNTGRRIEALSKIINKKADLAVIPAEALMQYFPNVKKFKAAHISLIKENEYPLDKLTTQLIEIGRAHV